ERGLGVQPDPQPRVVGRVGRMALARAGPPVPVDLHPPCLQARSGTRTNVPFRFRSGTLVDGGREEGVRGQPAALSTGSRPSCGPLATTASRRGSRTATRTVPTPRTTAPTRLVCATASEKAEPTASAIRRAPEASCAACCLSCAACCGSLAPAACAATWCALSPMPCATAYPAP